MRKRISFLAIFMQLSILAQYNEKTIIQDFNYDGIKDTLNSHYEGGSSFGGTYAKVINGKTNQSLEIDLFSAYSDMKNIITIPEYYYKKSNYLLLNALLREIFPEKRSTADLSLQWILNSYFSLQEITKNSYFSRIFHPNLAWNKDKIIIPDSYYIDLTKDTLEKLAPRNAGGIPLELKKHKGVMIYNTYSLKALDKNEKGFKMIASSKKHKLYATNHGIVAQKNEKHYKWLFITDPDVTGAPDRLRWKSIENARIIGDYVILEQNTPPSITYNVFIIHIETGIVAQLKFEFINKKRFYNNFHSNVALIGDSYFTFKGYDKKQKIYYTDVFNEFKKLSDYWFKR